MASPSLAFTFPLWRTANVDTGKQFIATRQDGKTTCLVFTDEAAAEEFMQFIGLQEAEVKALEVDDVLEFLDEAESEGATTVTIDPRQPKSADCSIAEFRKTIAKSQQQNG